MNDEEQYKRKFTKKEMKTYIYNTILMRLCEHEINIDFFEKKAKLFKHDSPEAIQALQKSLTAKESKRYDELTLEVIGNQLEKLESKKN